MNWLILGLLVINAVHAQLAVPPGLHLPLQHRQPARRSSPDALRDWALREKSRVGSKYGSAGVSPALPGMLERRATTSLSIAGYGTSTRTSTLVSTITSGGATTTRTSTAVSTRTAPVGFVDIYNFQADLEYFAAVGVGAPPQPMNVILDTGSADLWLASSACVSGCDTIPLFNATASNGSRDVGTPFSIRYGAGSASGDLWEDYVSLGGFNVSGQVFGLCETITNGLLSGGISGLMGLGWRALAASGATPFWQNLWQAGVLPFPGFAFHLLRLNNVSSAGLVEPGGSLTFGYINASLYEGDINWVNMTTGTESYWYIPLQGVETNGVNATSDDFGSVAVDTGTTLIGGPTAVISQIYGQVEGGTAATGDYAGYYSYFCDADVNVTFTFGDMRYNMTPEDFNLGPFGTQGNRSTCLGAFFDLSFPANSRISWVVGASFLKNVFTIFRSSPPSVGFGRLSATGNATHFTNSTGNATYTRNGTADIPTGIYGPSQGLTTAMPTELTTAIQAGQTVSRQSIGAASPGGRIAGPGELLLGALAMVALWTLGA